MSVLISIRSLWNYTAISAYPRVRVRTCERLSTNTMRPAFRPRTVSSVRESLNSTGAFERAPTVGMHLC